MSSNHEYHFPSAYAAIEAETKLSGFNMASDALTCSLLRTLAASKPSGRFLELGTGTGLSAAWILDGMDAASTLVSIDVDAAFLNIAKKFLNHDPRVHFELTDGAVWFAKNDASMFDYIFADTWHGKYLLLDEALDMLNAGGLYIIDDMLPQPNWPEGHAEKAAKLAETLLRNPHLRVTQLNWSTGIMIAVKI